MHSAAVVHLMVTAFVADTGMLSFHGTWCWPNASMTNPANSAWTNVKYWPGEQQNTSLPFSPFPLGQIVSERSGLPVMANSQTPQQRANANSTGPGGVAVRQGSVPPSQVLVVLSTEPFLWLPGFIEAVASPLLSLSACILGVPGGGALTGQLQACWSPFPCRVSNRCLCRQA